MDVASLGLMGVNVVMAGISMFAAEAARESAKPAVRFAFEQLKERVRKILPGLKLADREIDPELLRDKRIEADVEVAKFTADIIGNYSCLRRARVVGDFLVGAKILWVDDHPKNNVNEMKVLEQFGVEIDQARNSTEAMSRLLGRSFDLIVSDMERDGNHEAGFDLLRNLRAANCTIPLVFYVGKLDPKRSAPIGAFGIADQPEPLIHLVLDALERQRI
jgi:CheY-like chemotaxis protein